MKELELNLENLFKVGLTPEILKTDFVNWVVNNHDFIIDFDNKIIYAEVDNYKKDLVGLIETIKRQWLQNGMKQEEIDDLLATEKVRIKANYEKTLDVFSDDDGKREFILNVLPKFKKKIFECKEQFYNNKFNELIDETIESKIDQLSSHELKNKISFTNNYENPYPKIFKDFKAFTIFKNLQEEFSNTKENLSNYSFVFHKMTYEDLIHFDLKQQSYFDLLDKFDININRIKPLCDIGKIAFRESIYTKAK